MKLFKTNVDHLIRLAKRLTDEDIDIIATEHKSLSTSLEKEIERKMIRLANIIGGTK